MHGHMNVKKRRKLFRNARTFNPYTVQIPKQRPSSEHDSYNYINWHFIRNSHYFTYAYVKYYEYVVLFYVTLKTLCHLCRLDRAEEK